ncbi:hypothetical protein GG851_07095 [Bordetella petrii]|nr:hypothetical protein [Bordetella petrii]
MKTQITFKKLDGGDGVALVSGDNSDPLQAKQALAHSLGLPSGTNADIDDRLRRGGIEPASVQFNLISE